MKGILTKDVFMFYICCHFDTIMFNLMSMGYNLVNIKEMKNSREINKTNDL